MTLSRLTWDMSRAAHVVVISSWAPPMVGGPKNLYNLLSQFPDGSYTIVTSWQRMGRLGIDPGTWLTGAYVFFDRGHGSDVAVQSERHDLAGEMRWWSRGQWVGEPLRSSVLGRVLLGLLSPVRSVRDTLRMAAAAVSTGRRKRAHLLLGISDQGPALLATYLASRIIRIPYALYLYDLYRGNRLLPFDAFIARLAERRLLEGALHVVCTNERTVEYYRKRYGNRARYAVVPNSVFPEAYESRRTPFDPKAPFSLVYTGHVYWAQEQSLLNIIDAMRQLVDLPVRLELYVPNPPRSIIAAVGSVENVDLRAAPSGDMPAIQTAATLLILPLSWNTKSPDIIATATPGKLADYLASGRPILIHAPPEAYVTQLARRHRIGLVVDVNDPTAVAASIRHFIEDPTPAAEWISNALTMFYESHDARRNAARLMRLLGLAVVPRMARSHTSG